MCGGRGGGGVGNGERRGYVSLKGPSQQVCCRLFMLAVVAIGNFRAKKDSTICSPMIGHSVFAINFACATRQKYYFSHTYGMIET